MRKLLPVLIAATLLLIGAAVAILHFYNRPTELTVAVPQIEDDRSLLQAAAQVFARQHSSIRLHVITREGLGRRRDSSSTPARPSSPCCAATPLCRPRRRRW